MDLTMTRASDEIRQYEIMLSFERRAWLAGYLRVAGVDEAGRGPLAGPVAAAACLLDPGKPIYGLNDSKKLSPSKREALYQDILEKALCWQVAFVDADQIDEQNILQATCQAMRLAVSGLELQPDLLLVDAVTPDVAIPVWPIIHGDALSVSIAAASILAKVSRDRLMEAYDASYPAYGFAQHKGYGTKAHYAALLEYGPCPIHRLSFLKNLDQHKER